MAMIPVDAHVHFQDCFHRDRFLDAALSNFLSACEASGREKCADGFLLLTDPSGQDTFERWARWERDGGRGWELQPTDEPVSMIARREGVDGGIVVVAGRQIRTRERLEVLALGTAERIPDGLQFSEALRRAEAAAPLVSVPWGFGKWWFSRRGIIESLVRGGGGPHTFLGDNGGRPSWIPGPKALQERVGGTERPILPGSDPLPFPDHENRAGSFGFFFEGTADPRRPVEALTSFLSGRTSVRRYGTHRSLLGMMADQVRTRWPFPR